jgi:aryl-alcohol dehydrogenase-like predicted oxidoreductase
MTTEEKSLPGRTVQLGYTALRLPALGVGTMNWGDPSQLGRLDPGQLAYGRSPGLEHQLAAVDASIAGGAGLFDTAGLYGGGASERALGELTRGKDVFIATKFPSRLWSSRASDLPRALDVSLARLERGAVDLYQIHSPFPWLSIPRVMNRMADAVVAGKIRAVGVCNFSAKQMRWAHRALEERGIALASNQVEYSLLQRGPETDGVLDACRELGITLIAYMPLAMGALGGRYQGGRRPAGFRRYLGGFRAANESKLKRTLGLLAEIARGHSKSPAQVALRWLIERQVVPIPGSRNGEQARHNAGALTFALTESEVEALERATREWRERNNTRD